jgi:hypothetical protein
MTAAAHLRLLLRLVVAAPALPRAVVWFHGRAPWLALRRSDVFSMRSATSPRQLAELLRLARGRRRVVELGTATGWTGAIVIFDDCDHPEFPGVAEAIDELGLVGHRRDGMFVWEAPRAGGPTR